MKSSEWLLAKRIRGAVVCRRSLAPGRPRAHEAGTGDRRADHPAPGALSARIPRACGGRRHHARRFGGDLSERVLPVGRGAGRRRCGDGYSYFTGTVISVKESSDGKAGRICVQESASHARDCREGLPLILPTEGIRVGACVKVRLQGESSTVDVRRVDSAECS